MESPAGGLHRGNGIWRKLCDSKCCELKPIINKFFGYGQNVINYIWSVKQVGPEGKYLSHDPMCELFLTEVACYILIGASTGAIDRRNYICILNNNIFNPTERVFLRVFLQEGKLIWMVTPYLDDDSPSGPPVNKSFDVTINVTAVITYHLTSELPSVGADLTAAGMIAIVPDYISISVAGSYYNEGIAIFCMLFTYYLWIKSVKTGNIYWASLCDVAYFYMVSSWGGYVFLINLIPLHVLILMIAGRFYSLLDPIIASVSGLQVLKNKKNIYYHVFQGHHSTSTFKP